MDLDEPASKFTILQKVKSMVFRRSDSERQTEDNGRVRPSTAQHSPKASPTHTDPPLPDAEKNIAVAQLSTSPPSCPPPSSPLPSTPQSTTPEVFAYNERRTFPDGSYTSQDFWLVGDDDDETIPDEQQILSPDMVVGVTRALQVWLFKVRYEDSTLDRQFFNQLFIGERPASDFAEAVTPTLNNKFHVKWKPQWRAQMPFNLELDLDRFEALLSPGDNLLWYKQHSVCKINEGERIQHLCFDAECNGCATLSEQVKRKRAVEFITLVLELCEGALESEPGIANEILQLAHYDNPVRQYFITVNATSPSSGA